MAVGISLTRQFQHVRCVWEFCGDLCCSVVLSGDKRNGYHRAPVLDASNFPIKSKVPISCVPSEISPRQFCNQGVGGSNPSAGTKM
jgi:hypothetical protein